MSTTQKNQHAPGRLRKGEHALLTSQQAADYLGISSRKLWELSNCGEIPTVRIGRLLRFDPVDLRNSIEHWKEGGCKR